MLSVRDLESGYGLAQALHGVSLDVADGALVAVLGRNGMGKTTLCRSIMSLPPAAVWSGSIRYGDAELARLAPHKVAKLGVGYVPQGRRVFASLDVVENLTVAAPGPKAAGQWDVARIWDMFPRLSERQSSRAGQLSGGEQQMLAIARALMTNPTLLIMDEPSEGLAPMLVEQVGERLQELKGSSLSILLVEQNYQLALDLADVVYVIETGQVVFKGAPSELESDDGVRSRYLGVEV